MNSIFKFKKSKNILPAIDFSQFKCDLHSHLIPGIDDGASSMQDSIILIKGLIELGFKKIITTPHIMPGVYDNNVNIIQLGLDLLKKELTAQNIKINITASAEYYLDFNFFELAKKQELMSFQDNFILVELSFLDPPLNLYNIMFELQLMGYKVILAHPERYSYFNIDDYKKLKSKNVYLQINLLSLVGYYNIDSQKKAESLIDLDLVDFIGTDLHNSIQLDLYSKVKTNEYYHKLYQKNNLLNNIL